MDEGGKVFLDKVKSLIMNGSVDEVRAFIKLLDPKGKIIAQVESIRPKDIRLAESALFMDLLGELLKCIKNSGLTNTLLFSQYYDKVNHLLTKYGGNYLEKATNTPMDMLKTIKKSVVTSDLDTLGGVAVDTQFDEDDIDRDGIDDETYKKICEEAAEEAKEKMIYNKSMIWKVIDAKVKRAQSHQDQLRVYDGIIDCFFEAFVVDPIHLRRLQDGDLTLFAYDPDWKQKHITDPSVLQPIELFNPKTLSQPVQEPIRRGYPTTIELMVQYLRAKDALVSKKLANPESLTEKQRAHFEEQKDQWPGLLRQLNNLAMIALLYKKVDDNAIRKLLNSFMGIINEFMDGSMFIESGASSEKQMGGDTAGPVTASDAVATTGDKEKDVKKRGFAAIPDRITQEIAKRIPEFQHLLGDLKHIIMEIVFHNKSTIHGTFTKVMKNVPPECADLLESLKVKITSTNVQQYMTGKWDELLSEREKIKGKDVSGIASV
jgi:hypothetical protein